MTMLIMTFFVIFAFIAAIFRKRSLVLLNIGIALILLFTIGTGLAPRIAAQHLQIYAPLLEPEWKSANAIIVLGLGTVEWPGAKYISSPPVGFSRTEEAARLYYNCKKKSENCKLLTTGGDPSQTGLAEADVMARDLASLGIPIADILIEPKSNNTFQNAQFSSEILRRSSFDQIILVTSGLHMNRSLLYFSHFLIRAIPAPSDYWQAKQTVLPLAYNLTLMDMAVHEFMGLIRFQIYNVMGWNAKPVVLPQN